MIAIVFHGRNAAAFRDGFEALLEESHEIRVIADSPTGEAERAAYRDAEVIVGIATAATLPRPRRLRLFQVAGAGTDLVDPALLPATAAICNCYGHDVPIAEYVMAAILMARLPLKEADRRLRGGDWSFQAGKALHGEIAGEVMGVIGYGHIGRTIAARAAAFGMRVHIANRSPVAEGGVVERSFLLDALPAFLAGVDDVVVALPHTPETEGLIGEAAFAAMRPHVYLCNVGRGPVVDEGALFAALRDGRIRGAAIDTWYVYPSPADPTPQPARLPFATLPNVLMTPHMSGWTQGTIDRRRAAMADNVNRLVRGEPLANVVRPGR